MTNITTISHILTPVVGPVPPAAPRLLLPLLALFFTCLLLFRARPGWDATAAGALTPVVAARLDPNTATWWELSELAQIGESVARRIVEHRRSHPAATFQETDDLLAISGIGQTALRRIEPDLRFPVPAGR